MKHLFHFTGLNSSGTWGRFCYQLENKFENFDEVKEAEKKTKEAADPIKKAAEKEKKKTETVTKNALAKERVVVATGQELNELEADAAIMSLRKQVAETRKNLKARGINDKDLYQIGYYCSSVDVTIPEGSTKQQALEALYAPFDEDGGSYPAFMKTILEKGRNYKNYERTYEVLAMLELAQSKDLMCNGGALSPWDILKFVGEKRQNTADLRYQDMSTTSSKILGKGAYSAETLQSWMNEPVLASTDSSVDGFAGRNFTDLLASAGAEMGLPRGLRLKATTASMVYGQENLVFPVSFFSGLKVKNVRLRQEGDKVKMMFTAANGCGTLDGNKGNYGEVIFDVIGKADKRKDKRPNEVKPVPSGGQKLDKKKEVPKTKLDKTKGNVGQDALGNPTQKLNRVGQAPLSAKKQAQFNAQVLENREHYAELDMTKPELESIRVQTSEDMKQYLENAEVAHA